MKRAALLALAVSTAAAAYIPSAGSLFRRAATQPDEVDRARAVTLTGTLQTGDAPAVPATLQLRFPLRCRLHAKGDQQGALSVRGAPGAEQVEPEGKDLGAAKDLLSHACALLTFRGTAAAVGERNLRLVTAAEGVNADKATLGRLGERAVVVLGGAPAKPDAPQLWLYKDTYAPARLFYRSGDGFADLRLLEYGTAASDTAFPRVIELWQGGKLAARFEALEASGRKKGAGGEDEAE
jgi:hypothetical protein